MNLLRFAALTALLTPGCSALGLDQFPLETCAVDADCARLTTSMPPSDDCQSWQCNRETMHCELDLLDADEDGAPRMSSPSGAVCAMDATVDCDDAVATTRPGAAETCNGGDDDCNGLRDDGVAAVTSDFLLTAEGDALNGVVGRGPGGDDADLVALVSMDPGVGLATTVLVQREAGALAQRVLMPRQVGVVDRPMADLGRGPQAIARVGARFVTLYTEGGACQHLSVALIEPTAGEFVYTAASRMGLPSTDVRGCVGASRAALVPGASGGRALATYTFPGPIGAGTALDCDSFGTSPVWVTEITTGADTISFGAAPDATLGTASDWLAPAMLAIGPSTYLIAYSTGSAVEVHRYDGVAHDAELVVTEDVAMASGVVLGSDGDGGFVVGWGLACGTGAVSARAFSIAGVTGAVTVGERFDVADFGTPTSVTFHPALEEWAFVVQTDSGWSAARLDVATGEPIGAPVSVRSIASDVGPLVRARSSGAAYEVFGVEAGASAVGRATLDTVACLP